MQIFFTIIGLAACISGLMFAIIKFLEAVWFFIEFRDKANSTLDRIEERIRNIKQP